MSTTFQWSITLTTILFASCFYLIITWILEQYPICVFRTSQNANIWEYFHNKNSLNMIERLFYLNRMFSFQLCSFDWIDWWPFKAMYEDPRAHRSSSKCCAIGISMFRSPYEIHRHLSKRLIFLFSTYFSQQFKKKRILFSDSSASKLLSVVRTTELFGTISLLYATIVPAGKSTPFTRFAVLMRHYLLDMTKRWI